MIIEIVDSKEKIEAFFPILDTLVPEGLVTLEEIRVTHYKQQDL